MSSSGPETESTTAPNADSRARKGKSVTATLSRRIRVLRNERGLSLRSVATIAQISPSLLSQIERGEASPSLVSLMAIADALAVRPGVLLDEASAPPSPSRVVRRDDRRVIDDRLCRREYLMHTDEPELEVAELLMPPGGSSRPALAKHSGRDYGVVLEGSIVVEFAHRREVLYEGDYIAFASEDPHRIVNESDANARVMWMVAHELRPAGEPLIRELVEEDAAPVTEPGA